MEDVINKIIKMDKETSQIKRTTNEIISSKEKELRETLQNLENKYLEEGRIEGEKKYKEIIEAGKSEIELLQKKEDKVLKSIENLYKEKKTALIDELFHSLLG